MSRSEALFLAHYLLKIADDIPRGLSHLSDTVTFAAADLMMFARLGIKGKDFVKALTFAQSIPKVDVVKDNDELCSWMLHDVEHFKYWEK